MSRASTIKDISSAIKRVEEKKKQIDKELDNLRGALAFFESSQDESEMETAAEVLRNAIYEILKLEHPLHRNMIYDRLKEKGVDVPGKEPINNVGSHLSLDARFSNVGKGMWTINEAYVMNPSSCVKKEDGNDGANGSNESQEEAGETYIGTPIDELLRNNGIGVS